MQSQFDPIADFILFPDVPEDALRMVALLLIDTLGVAAGAANLEPAKIARDFAVDFQAAGSKENSARLLFDGRNCSVPGMAFASATQIDNLDGHDGFNPVKGHIGCAAVPALFAFATAVPNLSARDALCILAMSYEIGARAGLALHATVSDYHTSGAWNALAVAAIGCRLRGANKIQLREAMGIAEYHGPRSQMMREIANPTMLHDGSGMGALTGSMAALLAMRGFQGAPAITMEDKDVAPIWADLGKVWTINQNYIKPYPICRWAHAALDGLHAVMQTHNLSHKDIAHVRVGTFTESAALYPGLPETTGQAQYSLNFAIATLMTHGHVGPEHISGSGLQDTKVAALLPRISIHVEDRHCANFPHFRMADVIVTLVDGTKISSGDVHARGGIDAPMSEDEVAAKFENFAAPVIGKTRANSIWAMREGLLTSDLPFSALTDLVSTG